MTVVQDVHNFLEYSVLSYVTFVVLMSRSVQRSHRTKSNKGASNIIDVFTEQSAESEHQ